jgi:hypothetical protein
MQQALRISTFTKLISPQLSALTLIRTPGWNSQMSFILTKSKAFGSWPFTVVDFSQIFFLFTFVHPGLGKE